MNILFAASEAAPFIKSGGLGDVMESLPREISKIKENSVALVIPYYKSIKENENIRPQFVTAFYMPLAWRFSYVGVFRYVIKNKGVGRNRRNDLVVYFIDNEHYFSRDAHPYGYCDDGERFAFFSKAVLEFINHIDFVPDIIHCNDWQTGFVPLLLKALYKDSARHKNIKTVFTIHNIEYQGMADPPFLQDVLGVDESFRNIATYDGLINSLKSALVLSDKITTVSQTYSHELSFAYFARGMEKIIEENRYKMCGIVNGIDTRLYDASSDEYIEKNFKYSDLSGKEICKESIQRECNLPIRSDVPVIGVVSRLVSHKGMDLIRQAGMRLCNMDIQLVVLGTGDREYEDYFNYLSYIYPDKVHAHIGFDGAFARRIYAGADFFLMPSLSEPCGLSQLIAMRYGTIPIVSETGGLVDTVPPVNVETLEGRGFTFKLSNADDMMGAVERACDFFKDKEKTKKLKSNIMKFDSSWKNGAELYNGIYRELCNL